MTMYPLSGLLKSLPPVTTSRLILSGLGVWIVWGRQANETFYQTLQRFGGLKITASDHQSLWFFQNSQVFPALARLQIWAQIHPEPVTIQVLPAKMVLGESTKELSLSILSPLDEQSIEPGHTFEVWVHPDLAKQVSAFPGLSLQERAHPAGWAPASWLLFHADPNFSLDTELAWFFFVKPMQDPGNESFHQRWKQLYLLLKSILDRLGIRYIYQEGLLFFKIEGLALLSTWCNEILQTIARVKSEDKQSYWPCLFQGITPKGQALTDELPLKMELHWDRLPPDVPHVPLSAALLLRSQFQITMLDAAGRLSLESACQLTLLASPAETEDRTLAFPSSAALSEGSNGPCFYCGLKNHVLTECPSRHLFNWDPGIWDKMSLQDLKDMAKAVKSLDSLLAGTKLTSVPDLLQGEAPENIHARAFFEINTPVQHRMLRLVWRSRGKELPDGLRQLTSAEGDFIWAALENLRSGNPQHAERMMQQAILRAAKNYQPHVLLGFIALETGNPRKAETHWNDAQRLSYTPLQNSYLLFLKARLKETQLFYDQAHGIYREAQMSCPKWIEPRYRQGVCMVKKGFLDQAWSIFSDLLSLDPHIFNRLLIDVELERGRSFLLASLAGPWHVSKQNARKEQAEMEKMGKVLDVWFDPEDDFYQSAKERLDRSREQLTPENYVAFSKVIHLVRSLQKEMDQQVKAAVASIKLEIRTAIERLRAIREEMAGFPFPRLIRSISRDTNKCARILHTISLLDLNAGDKFRRARLEMKEAETLLQRLHKRLRSIKIMRDGSLFFLFLGKNFLWLAIVGLIASAIAVPVLLHSLQKADATWAMEWLTTQRWQVQRAVSTIMLIVSASIATLWTSFRFEKQKQKYLAKAKTRKRRP